MFPKLIVGDMNDQDVGMSEVVVGDDGEGANWFSLNVVFP